MKQRDEQLDERSKRILRELVALYCTTGEPVGSRTLSRRGKFDLSPATIRNVLADLEDMGYIEQPHTSAGRVPTDKGYRFYVNHLLRNQELNSAQKELIENRIRENSGSFEGLLDLTTTLLATLSHQIALAVPPNLHRLVLENIDFVPINDRRVLAILITQGGVVSNKILDLEEPSSHEELTRIANFIRANFSGLTLPTIRIRLLDLMKQEQTQYDLLLKKAAILGQQAVEANVTEGLFVNGASQVISYPEFSDSNRTRELLQALEEKSKILRILTQCIESEGIHILIGVENQFTDLKGMSLISSCYKYKDQPVGSLAILGPTRMEYGKMIPLVDHIAKVVSSILTKQN